MLGNPPPAPLEVRVPPKRSVHYLVCAACGSVLLVDCPETGDATCRRHYTTCSHCETGVMRDEGFLKLTVDLNP